MSNAERQRNFRRRHPSYYRQLQATRRRQKTLSGVPRVGAPTGDETITRDGIGTQAGGLNIEGFHADPMHESGPPGH